jgi:hypothetical protein
MSPAYEWLVSLETITGFILDSSALDSGQLGNLTTPLYDGKIRSVSMQGGRNRELDAVQPSTATIVFDNRDGLFSPENVSSPYYGSLFPGKIVNVQFVSKVPGVYFNAQYQFFQGFVSEWSYDFDVNGDATATLNAVDTLGILATIEIDNEAAPAEDTGTRMKRILELSGINASQYETYTGFSIMEATTLNGTALKLAQDTSFHEQSSLFSYRGLFLFYPRNRGASIEYATFTNQPILDERTFNYDSAQMNYSLDSVSNPVTATSSLGTAIALDSARELLYGNYSKSYQTSFSTFTQQQDFASYIVNFYGAPVFRPSSISFSMDKIFSDDISNSLNSFAYIMSFSVYVGTLIRFIFDDSSRGVNNNQLLVVSSFSHSSTPAGYNITLGLEPAVNEGLFILDDGQFGYGLLDTGILAF